MIEGFSFRDWLRNREKTILKIETDKNARQFEAVGEVRKDYSNAMSYELYNRGSRITAIEYYKRKKKKNVP